MKRTTTATTTPKKEEEKQTNFPPPPPYLSLSLSLSYLPFEEHTKHPPPLHHPRRVSATNIPSFSTAPPFPAVRSVKKQQTLTLPFPPSPLSTPTPLPSTTPSTSTPRLNPAPPATHTPPFPQSPSLPPSLPPCKHLDSFQNPPTFIPFPSLVSPPRLTYRAMFKKKTQPNNKQRQESLSPSPPKKKNTPRWGDRRRRMCNHPPLLFLSPSSPYVVLTHVRQASLEYHTHTHTHTPSWECSTQYRSKKEVTTKKNTHTHTHAHKNIQHSQGSLSYQQTTLHTSLPFSSSLAQCALPQVPQVYPHLPAFFLPAFPPNIPSPHSSQKAMKKEQKAKKNNNTHTHPYGKSTIKI